MRQVLAGRTVAGQDGPKGDQALDLGGIDVVEHHALATHRVACRLGRHRFPLWSRGERRRAEHHDLYMPPGVSTP